MVLGRFKKLDMSGVYPWGHEEDGGMYMLYMFMSCLCTLMRVDWSSM